MRGWLKCKQGRIRGVGGGGGGVVEDEVDVCIGLGYKRHF